MLKWTYRTLGAKVNLGLPFVLRRVSTVRPGAPRGRSLCAFQGLVLGLCAVGKCPVILLTLLRTSALTGLTLGSQPPSSRESSGLRVAPGRRTPFLPLPRGRRPTPTLTPRRPCFLFRGQKRRLCGEGGCFLRPAGCILQRPMAVPPAEGWRLLLGRPLPARTPALSQQPPLLPCCGLFP